MSSRTGKRTFVLDSRPQISQTASICGKKEGEGPLGGGFDMVLTDDIWGEKSWELAESKMQREALRLAIEKRGICEADIDCMFAGDLLNQCIGAHYALENMRIPFFGLYGACSTFCEGMSLAAMLVDAGFSGRSACITSSHFCSAEKQFRMPLGYGGQRTPTAQWTATAAGAAIIEPGTGVNILSVTPGRIVDMGISDASNMGAAMAPAALDTLEALFGDTGTSPADYDMILTGDLGTVGSDILCDMASQKNTDIYAKHEDCGCMIFDAEKQDVHAGGSGCGCIASVFCSEIIKRLERGEIGRMILMATGALMNTQSLYQGKSIPSIAHALVIEGRK